MTTRGYNTNGYHNGMSFHDINDDNRMHGERFTPITLRPNRLEYQPRRRDSDYYEEKQDFRREEKSKSTCCSKRCIIGLIIGLLIGVLMVLAVALPVGLVKYRNCGLGEASSTPNWIGTYEMDGGCATTTCCCYSDAITITQSGSSQMRISGSVTGLCTTIASPYSLTGSMPSTFQTTISWGLDPIRIVLGADNSYISLVNINYGICSATAYRTSYNNSSQFRMNIGLIILILFPRLL